MKGVAAVARCSDEAFDDGASRWRKEKAVKKLLLKFSVRKISRAGLLSAMLLRPEMIMVARVAQFPSVHQPRCDVRALHGVCRLREFGDEFDQRDLLLVQENL